MTNLADLEKLTVDKMCDTDTKRIMWNTYCQEVRWDGRKTPYPSMQAARTLARLDGIVEDDEVEYFIRARFHPDICAPPARFSSMRYTECESTYELWLQEKWQLLSQVIDRIKNTYHRYTTVALGWGGGPDSVACFMLHGSCFAAPAAQICIRYPGLLESELLADKDTFSIRQMIQVYKDEIYLKPGKIMEVT